MAERSSQATKEITKLINESVKRIAQGGEISKEAAGAFKKIVEGVTKTTKSISEISVAAQEQQTAARDVSNAIQKVVDSTEKSAIASDGIAKATDDLSNGAEKLKVEVEKFAVGLIMIGNEIDNKCFHDYIDFIHKLTGITIDKDRSSMLVGRIEKVSELGLGDYESYLEHVGFDKLEQSYFTNLITTNETYFYRTPRIWSFIEKEFLTANFEHDLNF